MGDRHKWREGSGTTVDVIPRVHDIESEIFDGSGMRGDLIEGEFARLKPKTKWVHVMSLPTRWATSRAATGNVCSLVAPRRREGEKSNEASESTANRCARTRALLHRRRFGLFRREVSADRSWVATGPVFWPVDSALREGFML